MSPLLQVLLVPVVLTLVGAVVWLLFERRRNRSVRSFETRREARREITGTGFFGEHREGDDVSRVWRLELDEYERANLIWLLRAIGYPHGNPDAFHPAHYFDTGDWVGQLYWKLEGDHPPELKPNTTTEQVRVYFDLEYERKGTR